jgi:hypothetical protein
MDGVIAQTKATKFPDRGESSWGVKAFQVAAQTSTNDITGAFTTQMLKFHQNKKFSRNDVIDGVTSMLEFSGNAIFGLSLQLLNEETKEADQRSLYSPREKRIQTTETAADASREESVKRNRIIAPSHTEAIYVESPSADDISARLAKASKATLDSAEAALASAEATLASADATFAEVNSARASAEDFQTFTAAISPLSENRRQQLESVMFRAMDRVGKGRTGFPNNGRPKIVSGLTK